MKNLFLLFTFLVISVSAMAVPSPACPSGNCGTPGTALPINYGVIYLLAAGLVIGIVAIKKHRSLVKA